MRRWASPVRSPSMEKLVLPTGSTICQTPRLSDTALKSSDTTAPLVPLRNETLAIWDQAVAPALAVALAKRYRVPGPGLANCASKGWEVSVPRSSGSVIPSAQVKNSTLAIEPFASVAVAAKLMVSVPAKVAPGVGLVRLTTGGLLDEPSSVLIGAARFMK